MHQLAASTLSRRLLKASISVVVGLMLSTSIASAKESAKAKAKTKKGEAAVTTATKNPTVIMETSMGTLEIELNKEKAPATVENFLKYVNEGFYNGTIFHRVIGNFMIQGGGFTPDMKQKSTHAPIKNEADNGLKNEVGTLAMARTSDPDSATAQFFINVADNSFLNRSARDAGYAVFGKVVNGMDVVNKIKGVATTNKGMHENVPTTPVEIKSVKVK
jgi:cyclophilin family peptidyl-prolyl cis-trans isomerase